MVLLLEFDVELARGVIISGGPGGPLDSVGEWTVLHDNGTLTGSSGSATLAGSPRADARGYFLAEERLTKVAAAHLRSHLEAAGTPFVALAGCARWRPAMALVEEVERGLCVLSPTILIEKAGRPVRFVHRDFNRRGPVRYVNSDVWHGRSDNCGSDRILLRMPLRVESRDCS